MYRHPSTLPEASPGVTWVLCVAALLGASAVGMSAYASHGLGFLAEGPIREAARNSLQQAAHIQLVHAPALLALGLGAAASPQRCRAFHWPAGLFSLGILLFSGLIYLRIFSGYSGLSPLVPIGGSLLILAWLSLIPMAYSLRFTPANRNI